MLLPRNEHQKFDLLEPPGSHKNVNLEKEHKKNENDGIPENKSDDGGKKMNFIIKGMKVKGERKAGRGEGCVKKFRLRSSIRRTKAINRQRILTPIFKIS